MRIIAATDFSAAAAGAVRAAARLARRLGDDLLLVHVMEPPVRHAQLRVPETGAFDGALRHSARDALETTMADLRDLGLAIEGRVLSGPAASTILALAAQETPRTRMVVLGGRRHGALARLIVGCVAEWAALAASCPVLIVPEGVETFEDWSAGGRPLRVVAGLDLDGTADSVLEVTRGLRAGGACDLTLLHLYWPPAEYSRLGLTGEPELLKTDPRIVAVLERELKARRVLQDLGEHTRLSIQSAWGRPGDALADEAAEEKADLTVVGTRQPHGWARLERGSSAIATIRASRNAVLCVPAGPAATATIAPQPVPTLGKVLVATDLSALGNAAVPFAYSLLRGGGTVELCHVHERAMPVPGYLPYDVSERLPEGKRAELEGELANLIPAEATRLEIASHVQVVDGASPAGAIVQAARRLGADAIVLASNGRSGLRRALVGSVAEAVLRHADVPVFIVRQAA
jgi:nucleotide-binding universal stress UspA family protein